MSKRSMADEYTERKIRVYNVKKKDGNPIVKGATAVAKGFYSMATDTSSAKKARVQA